MSRPMRFLALVPVAVATIGGCATVETIRARPLTDGRVYRYAASPDSLASAATRALPHRGAAVAEVTRPDTVTRIVIGSRGASLFGWGELYRFVAQSESAGCAAVRVVSQPTQTLSFQRDRAPELFRALDRELDPRAIGPFAGDLVRLTMPPRVIAQRGTVVSRTGDSLMLAVGRRDTYTTVAWNDLTDLAVNRGSYRHTREGALIGALLGMVVGGLIASSQADPEDWYPALPGIGWGLLVGTVSGTVVGSSVRTEVWSPVPVEHLRPFPTEVPQCVRLGPG